MKKAILLFLFLGPVSQPFSKNLVSQVPSQKAYDQVDTMTIRNTRLLAMTKLLG